MNDQKTVWEDTSSEHHGGGFGTANKVFRLARGASGMEELRKIFPEGTASGLDFVFFSTSGVHGSYTTIEEYEKECDIITRANGITFLIVNPRIVGMRYGNVHPVTPEDFEFLKKLRASSHQVTQKIGNE